MKKTLMLVLVFAVTAAFASATYNIKKLPAGSATPTLDGSLVEWPVEYLVDSVTADSNAYAEARASEPWARADFQMYLYCTYDDAKLYYAIKVMADDVLKNCATGVSACDNIKINQLGKGTAMYIFMNGTLKPNPSCPWTNGTTFWSGTNPTGNSGLPIYEFALDKETTAPFGATTYQLSPGTEECDNMTTCDAGGGSCTDQSFLCVGANGPADKHDWGSNPWDNAQYWPTWSLTATTGPALVSAEKAARILAAENIFANPNPFTASTTIAYKAINAGKLSIYSVSGKLVKSFSTRDGSHSLTWNGLDNSGKAASDGLYIARLTSGSKTYDVRLFLAR